jgi:hypothetical protein
MDRHFTTRRRLIYAGLAVLLAGDLALAFYNWRTSVADKVPMAQLEADSRKLQLLSADIENAAKIQQNLPATVTDYNKFDGTFLPASRGNSAVAAELDEVAKKSGVQIQSVGFRHADLAGRNLTQVDLDAIVNGDYGGIVRFMNNLQRSNSFYIVESLSLQAEGQGGGSAMRIGLHMRTYFRTAA